MNVHRRVFLKSSGLALVGMGAIPPFLQRLVFASPTGNRKILITIFQRGAADGLNVVIPFGEKGYYNMRPTIAVPSPKRGDVGRHSIWMDSLVSIPHFNLLRRFTIEDIWRWFMPWVHLIARDRILMPRISWNRVRPVLRAQPTAGLTGIFKASRSLAPLHFVPWPWEPHCRGVYKAKHRYWR